MKWSYLFLVAVLLLSVFYIFGIPTSIEVSNSEIADSKPLSSEASGSKVASSECCLKPVYEDHAQEGKYLCSLQGYIGVFVDESSGCNNGLVYVGTMVTLATVNKIVGGIGDANMDGDCNEEDVPGFINCLQGITSPDFDCLCTFDYDDDGDIDIKDYGKFQLAFGTGNTRWREETYGTN